MTFSILPDCKSITTAGPGSLTLLRITCGIYVNISIHDYLRALMGFHAYNTDFTLDPRIAMTEHKNVSRGIGNQVTVEFNLLYRFHCAISLKDEEFTEDFMREMRANYLENQAEAKFVAQTQKPKDWRPWDQAKRQQVAEDLTKWEPKDMSLNEFFDFMRVSRTAPKEPWEREFGLRYIEESCFKRNAFTGLFDDGKMIEQLQKDMQDPICRLLCLGLCSSLTSLY